LQQLDGYDQPGLLGTLPKIDAAEIDAAG